MKSKIVIGCVLVIAIMLIGACSVVGTNQSAKVAITSNIASSGSRLITPNTAVTTISSYRVVFKKIEVGNSEQEKYTLWEDSVGQLKDIANPVNFDGVATIPSGSYNFVRLTVGDTLNVDGSIDDSGSLVTGSGTTVLNSTIYLWGSGVINAQGESTLTSPVVVRDGGTLAFNFNTTGTVTYLSGAANAAVLGVVKPVLTLTTK